MYPTDEEIKILKKAGAIVAQVRDYGAGLIKEGAVMVEVCDQIEDKIHELGAEIAFPAQISMNNIAAHYCSPPNDTTTFSEGDLAKLDVGVHLDGYVADSAVTVNLGADDNIVKAAQDALDAALKVIRPDIELGEIGRTIQEAIESYDLSPVKNLSGHGLDRFEIHSYPSIPNYDTQDETELSEGEVVAIEPFATNGEGKIFESTNPTIFSLLNKKPVRLKISKQILNSINKFNGLPFTTRWLTPQFTEAQLKLGFSDLVRQEIIEDHPPLPEAGGGLVSQAEHSVIVKDKPIVYTRDIDD